MSSPQTSTRHQIATSGAAQRDFSPLVSLCSYVTLHCLVLFIAAGSLVWPGAWAFLAVYCGAMAINVLILIYVRPELIAERKRIKKDTKTWDKVLGILIIAASLATCAVAGLDLRFGWTTPVMGYLSLAALAVAIPGHVLFLWALASNSFFSATVRLQKERGHSVATGGPYRFVRHPAYLGSVLLNLAAPLILGFWPALIPAVITACLIVLRTALEDKMLREELNGYAGFARRVRYRLIPGIW